MRWRGEDEGVRWRDRWQANGGEMDNTNRLAGSAELSVSESEAVDLNAIDWTMIVCTAHVAESGPNRPNLNGQFGSFTFAAVLLPGPIFRHHIHNYTRISSVPPDKHIFACCEFGFKTLSQIRLYLRPRGIIRKLGRLAQANGMQRLFSKGVATTVAVILIIPFLPKGLLPVVRRIDFG